jgi:hypothetical protein
MSSTTASMFARVPYFTGKTRVRSRVVSVPLITALIEPGSRYSLTDPRVAPPTPLLCPKLDIARRGPHGPRIAAIERMWAESGHDRAEFRRKLEARLRKDRLISQHRDDAKVEKLLAADDIDAPFDLSEKRLVTRPPPAAHQVTSGRASCRL